MVKPCMIYMQGYCFAPHSFCGCSPGLHKFLNISRILVLHEALGSDFKVILKPGLFVSFFSFFSVGSDGCGSNGNLLVRFQWEKQFGIEKYFWEWYLCFIEKPKVQKLPRSWYRLQQYVYDRFQTTKRPSNMKVVEYGGPQTWKWWRKRKPNKDRFLKNHL